MERVLEIFHDGSIYEMEGEVAVKVTATEGQVKLLSKALRFTLAKTGLLGLRCKLYNV